MRRYLLVLDMDLLALDEDLDQQPIDYLLATGRQGGGRLASTLHRGPVHQLRRRWGQRLVTFTPGPGTKPNELQRN